MSETGLTYNFERAFCLALFMDRMGMYMNHKPICNYWEDYGLDRSDENAKISSTRE